MLKNELNMNYMVLTSAAVIKAQALAVRAGSKTPAYARAHIVAIMQWENQALNVIVSMYTDVLKEDEPSAFKDMPRTIAGLPLKTDNKLYPDRIIFHAEDGEQVAAITNLPIITGFDVTVFDTPELNEETAKDWLFE